MRLLGFSQALFRFALSFECLTIISRCFRFVNTFSKVFKIFFAAFLSDVRQNSVKGAATSILIGQILSEWLGFLRFITSHRLLPLARVLDYLTTRIYKMQAFFYLIAIFTIYCGLFYSIYKKLRIAKRFTTKIALNIFIFEMEILFA